MKKTSSTTGQYLGLGLLFLMITANFPACASANGFPIVARGEGYYIETRSWPAKSIPGFPESCNRIQAQVYSPQEGSPKARLVLVSGWTCGSAWFFHAGVSLARKGIEVWAVDRRPSLFENRQLWEADRLAVINQASNQAQLGNQSLALKRLQDPASYLIGKSTAPLGAIGYGLILDDLDQLILEAGRDGTAVFLGGWSDGVEYVGAYSQRDFSKPGEKPLRGHERLKGLVFLDENCEWGLFPPADQAVKLSQALKAARTEVYETRWPAVTIFEALGQAGKEESKWKRFFPASSQARANLTGEALLGWLYDGAGYNSGWSWLVSSGGFDRASPLTGWENGEKTPIERVVKIHQAPGTVWEWFYPHQISVDYWELGVSGFNHQGLKIAPDPANRLPVFLVLSGFNPHSGKEPPAGIKWWLGKTGISEIECLNLMDFRHADILLSPEAEARLWHPLSAWITNHRRSENKR